MMRSMFSGVSGLRIHQTKMDVIANNIANVNTMGFKSSRVTFADIFSQTTQSAARGYEETGRGGTNPMQIGLGSAVMSIDLQMTQGAAQRTDNPYDLMIQGSGMFIVSDNAGTYFSRAGAFNLDEAGWLVNPQGMKLMGWQRSEIEDQATGEGTGTYYIQRGPVQPIRITEPMRYSPPQQTRNISFEDNLNSIQYIEPVISTISFYDSLGNRFTADVTFTKGDPTTTGSPWTWAVGTAAFLDGNRSTSFPLTAVGGSGTIWFDSNGKMVSIPPTATVQFPVGSVSTTTPPITLAASNLTQAGGEVNIITLDFSKITQFGEKETNIKSYTDDGYAPGNLINVSISPDGMVNGLYSNGQMAILWQVVVANFRNPAGLEKLGDNLYMPTPNSGEFDGIGETIASSGGKLMGGVLEMSNVDLAQEFTEMITTQRGFQANSRIITVSDDMLAELVNLKR